MAILEWDKVGERIYQTGIDRGVLYLPNGSGIPWNGLVSVTEQFDQELRPYYLDGVKYLQVHSLGDYAAEIKALTYPDEFDDICGIHFIDEVNFHDQRPKSFSMSYRTRIGNDVDGNDLGYKIHIIYNLKALPSSIVYATVSNAASPIPFTWNVSGVPVHIPGRRPTCHISIDSTKVRPEILSIFEERLYGSEDSDPVLPPLTDFLIVDDVIIIDNGDGTWTASGPDEFVEMLDATTFEIEEAEIEYLDEDTYEISSSEDT